ncbi:MAG: toxin TumE [bacterium]
MLHSALQKYLDEIDTVVRSFSNVHIERYLEQILSPDRINLRIRLRFANGCLLEMNEAVVVADEKIEALGYRYHFQNAQQALIFRYDDTPHFPKLSTFPHHKHLPETTIATTKPSIPEVIAEALSAMQPIPKS